MQELAQTLVKAKEELQDVRKEVRTHEVDTLDGNENNARTEALLQTRREAEMQSPSEKFLVCRGNAPNVPLYLRATGKVENRNLSRAEIVVLLSEFWEARGASEKSRNVALDEFLDNWFRRKFPGKDRVINAYNIMYGVGRFSFDTDCHMFTSIIDGSLPEGAYYGQQEMIEGLKAALQKADKINHGGRIWNTVERDEFTECLTSFFPLKTRTT